MKLGEKSYMIDGEEKVMDVAPIVENDISYVSLRFIAEGLGYPVVYISRIIKFPYCQMNNNKSYYH